MAHVCAASWLCRRPVPECLTEVLQVIRSAPASLAQFPAGQGAIGSQVISLL